MQKEAEKEGSKINKQNAKLKNNTLFDKSIENPMKNIDVKILITSKQYLKWSFRPTFKRENNFLMEEPLSKRKMYNKS